MAYDPSVPRKAGKSDTEIAEYLGRELGYDISVPRKAGKSDTEIVEYLSKNDRPASVGKETQAKPVNPVEGGAPQRKTVAEITKIAKDGGIGAPQLELPEAADSAAPLPSSISLVPDVAKNGLSLLEGNYSRQLKQRADDEFAERNRQTLATKGLRAASEESLMREAGIQKAGSDAAKKQKTEADRKAVLALRQRMKEKGYSAETIDAVASRQLAEATEKRKADEDWAAENEALKAEKALAPDRSLGEAVNDSWQPVAQSGLGIVGGGAYLLGAKDVSRAMLEESALRELDKSQKTQISNKLLEHAKFGKNLTETLVQEPLAIMDMVLQSSLMTLPGMGLGRAAAAVTAKRMTAQLGQRAASAARTRLLAQGADAGRVAGQRVVQKAAGKAALAGGVAGEAAVSGGMNGSQAEQQVREMNPIALQANSPRYRELLEQGMAPDAAQETLAQEVGHTTALLTALATSGGGVVAKYINGKANFEQTYSRAVGAPYTLQGHARGLAGESVEELMQNPLETMAGNRAQQAADDTVGLMDDVAKSAALGPVAAFGQSGATQGLGHVLYRARGGAIGDSAPVNTTQQSAQSGVADHLLNAANTQLQQATGGAPAGGTSASPVGSPTGSVDLAALQAEADAHSQRSQEFAVLADEARALGDMALAAHFEAQSQSAAAAAKQSLDTLQTEHTGLQGIVNRTGITPPAIIPEEATRTVDGELTPAGNGELTPAGNGISAPVEQAASSSKRLPLSAAEVSAGQLDAGNRAAVGLDALRDDEELQPVEANQLSAEQATESTDKPAGEQEMRKRMAYLRGAIAASGDDKFKASAKAELRELTNKINSLNNADQAAVSPEASSGAAPESKALTKNAVASHRLETAKAEILRDIASGKVPDTVRSFSELQDHVDANMYINDYDRPDRMIGPLGKQEGWGANEFADFTNSLVQTLDSWLSSGRVNDEVAKRKPLAQTDERAKDEPKNEPKASPAPKTGASPTGLNYPNRKLRLEFAKTEDGGDPNAWANIALANLQPGDVVKVGNDSLTVKSVGSKAVTFTKADGKTTRFDVDTPRMEKLVRDVASLLEASHHSSHGRDWVNILSRDPTFNRSNGVISLRDTKATMDVDAMNARPEAAKPETAKPEVSDNTIFTEDAAEKAREILRQALRGTQLNTGLDPKVLQAALTLSGYHVERGARTFAAYSQAMINDLGDVVRPYLKSWYMALKYDPRAAGMEGMSSEAEVNAESSTDDSLQANDAVSTGDERSRPASGNDSNQVVLQNRNRSDAAYVQQMTSIAANPDAGRLGFSRDFSSGAPVILQDTADIPDSQKGRVDFVVTAEGRRIPVQYAVVEAKTLLPSNRADGTAIHGYEEGIQGMSRVVAGSGRTAALQKAWQQGTAAGYADGVSSDTHLHEVSPASINNLDEPTLVRIMSPNDVTENIGDESNVSGVAQKSAIENARDDARRVDLTALTFGEDGEITAESVRQFVRSMPVSEQTGMLGRGGQPTTQAVDRLMGAIFHHAYGSDALTELFAQATEPDARNVLKGLAIAAPSMMQLNSDGIKGTDLDIRDLVSEAAQAVVNAQRRGQKLVEFLNQTDIDQSPEITPILRMFAENSRSAKRMGDILQGAAEFAYDEATRDVSGGLFGDAVPRATKQQVLERIHDSARSQNLGQQRGAITDGGHAQANTPDSRAAGNSAKAQGEQQDSTARGQGQQGRVGTDDFALTAQTEEELAQREAAQQQAEADRQTREQKASQKAQADKDRNDFTLTGSDSAIDEAEARGQGNMFDAPSVRRGDYHSEPSEAQKKAGNYKKEHVRWHGLDLAIETQAGTMRRGVDANGKPWAVQLAYDYGYFKRTEGADGDAVDAFIGANLTGDKVFIVNQRNGKGGFDEHKVMLGFESAEAARAGYLANYSKGWKQFDPDLVEMSVDQFRDWLRDGDTKSPAIESASSSPDVFVSASNNSTDFGETTAEQVSPVGTYQHKNHPQITVEMVATDKGFSVDWGDGTSASFTGKNAAEKAAATMKKEGFVKSESNSGQKENASKNNKQDDEASQKSTRNQLKAEAAKEADANKIKLESFGEKLEGKRNSAASLLEDATDADIANQPLSKTWPANAHEKVKDNADAALMYAAREAIPSKPRDRRKLERWVEKVKAFRILTNDALLKGTEGQKELLEKMRKSRSLQGFADKVELLTQIDRQYWKRIGEIAIYPDAQRVDETGSYIPNPFGFYTVDGRRHRVDGAKNVADILDAVKNALGESTGSTDKKIAFEVRRRSDGTIFAMKKGDKEQRSLKEFAKGQEKAALAYLKANYDDVLSAWNAVKESDNVSKADTRKDTNAPRTGKDHRNGKDVTPEMFSKAFGFRGVEFGGWVSQGKNAKERQGMLNLVYDSLHDLADIIGVPPRAISLNGSLGLALGSRGSGNAAAHFERDNLVINLTKTKGAGTLAHEWFHALDNYFSRMREGQDAVPASRENAYITYKPESGWVRIDNNGKPIAYSVSLTKAQLQYVLKDKSGYDGSKSLADNAKHFNYALDPAHKNGVRPQVEAAFAELVEALNASPMAKRATVLDKGANDGYWSRIIERGARSFENYVINKMRSLGYDNDYLANVRSIDEFARDKGRYPYLLPSEEQPIVDAFDNLFGTIETRESGNGNVEMYSIAASTRSAYESRIDALFAEASQSSGLNAEALRQVLTGSLLGNDIAVLLDSGRIVLHSTPPKGIDSRAEGWTTKDGVVHLVAGNLTAETVMPTLLHEMFHSRNSRFRNTPATKKLMADLQALYKQYQKGLPQGKANQFWRKAMERVQDAGVPAHQLAEEFGAYAITEYESAPKTIRDWVDRFVQRAKAYLRRSYGIQLGELTPAQLREMAVQALRTEATLAREQRQNDNALAVEERNAPYETDLFGNPLPDNRGKTGRGQSARPALSGNVQSVTGLQDTPATAGDYFTRTIIGREALRTIPVSRITNEQEAAQATSYLFKSAVERFDGIVTDKDGKPLAVIGGFKGALAESNVYSSVLIAEAMRISGAAKVWFSHNHPSGKSDLSSADKNIIRHIADVFDGSGIEVKGILAVGRGTFSFSTDGRGEHNGTLDKPNADNAGMVIPVISREALEEDAPGAAITSPAVAKEIAKQFYQQDGDGIVLLNKQNNVIAWIPASPVMLGDLKNTGGLAAIYRAVSEANAGSAILVHDGSFNKKHPRGAGDGTIGGNIAKALEQAGVTPLDSIEITITGTAASQAERIGYVDINSAVYSKMADEHGITVEEAKQQLKDAHARAEKAAVEATTGYLERQRQGDLRSALFDKYDNEYSDYGTINNQEVSMKGLPIDEDGDLTSEGSDQYIKRKDEMIEAAIAADLEAQGAPIESLDDIDSRGSKWQAADAAKAWLDAMGVSWHEVRSAGSEYIEIRPPEETMESDEDDNDHTLKLRFSTHENQSRQHSWTEHNWVEGREGVSLIDMLDAARRFSQGETGLGEKLHYSLAPSEGRKGITESRGEFYSKSEQWYFSPLARAVEGMKQETALASQWRAMIEKAPGVKSDELEATGVIEWLQAAGGKVKKSDILDFLADKAVIINDVMKGENNGKLTKSALDKRLRSGLLGSFVGRMIDNGSIILHASSPARHADGAEGWTESDGTIHLVANALRPATVLSTLLHELFHRGNKAISGTKAHQKLMKGLESLYKQYKNAPEGSATNEFYKKAVRRVEGAKTKEAQQVEEFGAYAITAFELAPRSVRKWVQEFIGNVKAWMLRRLGIQAGDITPAQLRAMAVQALRSVASEQAATSQRQETDAANATEAYYAQASREYDITAEEAKQQFKDAERAYGGKEAWQKAKDAGRTKLNYQQWVQVRTPAFKNWFGDWDGDPENASKVVDPTTGEPMVVYHGTKGDIAEFDSSQTVDGGFHFGTTAQASMRVSGAGKNLMPVYLKIEDWQRSKDLGGKWKAKIKSAKSSGKDGIVYLNRYEGIDYATIERAEAEGFNLDKVSDARLRDFAPELADSYIVFDPTQIKSAIGNRGTFDPADPNILYSYTDEELDFLVADGSLSPEHAANLKATAKSRGQNANTRTASTAGRAKQADARGDRAGEVAGRTVAGAAPRSGWEAATAVRGADGKPARIFRGSIDGVVTPDNFKPEQFGKASGYATSGLGVFFSTWHSDAQKYANNTGGRVGSFFLDIRNPRVFTSDQLPEFDSVEQATEFREALRALGHDGIAIDYTEVKGPVQMVAFDPEQVILPADDGLSQPSRMYSIAEDEQSSPYSNDSEFHKETRRLREKDKTAWSKARNWWKRNFYAGGLLPDGVYDEKIKRDGAFNAIEHDVTHLTGMLTVMVKKEYGKDLNKLSEAEKELMADALAGKWPGDTVKLETRATLLAMRKYIDSLSGEYTKYLADKVAMRLAINPGLDLENDADARLLETITGNIGRYVHRSYRAFDDKNWYKEVPESVINDAMRYLMGRHIENGETEAEARRRAEVAINEIIKTGTAYDSMDAFIAEGKLGAKDLSILIKRKEIAPEIRALLGEYKDPRLNFAKSATKMARLVWNQRLLDRVRDIGLGTFLFTDDTKPANATVQIAGESSEVYAPLNGLWTTPEIAQAFKDILGKDQLSDLMRHVVAFNAAIKYGKTVLSPTTAMRNIQSALFFTVANGHFDYSKVSKAIEAFKEQVLGKTGDAYMRRMLELGVTYDTPNMDELKQWVRESGYFMANEDAIAPRKWLSKLNERVQGFYRFGDDFWKIIGFENEKAVMLKAGLPLAEAEARAAQRIRNTYPTYSMIGRGTKWLSRFPLVGTFVSFPAEIIRTSGHIFKYMAQDIRSNNKQIRAMGARKLVGAALVSGGFYALSALTRAAFDMDDDDEEVIRVMAPEWSKNSTFLFWGRNEKTGQMEYTDLSFLDPYGYWKRPITAMMRDQPWDNALASGMRDMLAPFFSWDITTNTILEVIRNKKASGSSVYDETASRMAITGQVSEYIAKSLSPGFIGNIQRIYSASKDEKKATGQPYVMKDEMMALVGWRHSTTDPRAAIRYRAMDYLEQNRIASGALNRVLREQNTLSDERIVKAVEQSVEAKQRIFKDMSMVIKAAMKSGMDDIDVEDILRAGSISKDAAISLTEGEMPEVKLSMTSIKKAVQAAEAAGDYDRVDALYRRYDVVQDALDALGAKLEEEQE